MGTDLEPVSALLRAADPRDRLRGIRELSRLSRALAPEDREGAVALLAPLARDPDVAGVHAGHDCGGGVVQGSHVHPVGAEQDHVGLLAGGQAPTFESNPFAWRPLR